MTIHLPKMNHHQRGSTVHQCMQCGEWFDNLISSANHKCRAYRISQRQLSFFRLIRIKWNSEYAECYYAMKTADPKKHDNLKRIYAMCAKERRKHFADWGISIANESTE